MKGFWYHEYSSLSSGDEVDTMNQKQMILAAVAAGIGGVAVFHAVHYMLYCRYKKVPGRSHCSVCGHRRICQKYHSR